MKRSPRPLSWRDRVRALLRPPRTLKVTPTGRTFLVLTVGVGLGALNTGNNLLYLVLGLQLSMIVVSGVLSEQTLRGLRVRRLGAEAAYAGEPFGFRWAVMREKGGHTFAITLSEDGPGAAGSATLGYVPGGVEKVLRAQLTVNKRGPHLLSGIRVTTTWPLGLFAKTRVYDDPGLLLVYPRRGFSCTRPGEDSLGPLGEAGNPRKNDGSGDLVGLRELRENEDARRVHWLKSASAGKLLRTEREREEKQSYVLKLPEGLAPSPLDRACEELSALAARLLSEGHEVGLEHGQQRLRPATGPGQQRRILEALAWAGHEHLREERA